MLNVRYSSPRIDYNTFADCTARPGYLRMRGQESFNSLHHVSLLGVRQQAVSCEAETAMTFVPDYSEQVAGLAYMYDAYNFYLIGKTITDEGQAVLCLLKSDSGVITDEIEPLPIPREGEIRFRVSVSEDGTRVKFLFSTEGENWQQAGGIYTTEILTDEHCRGFTGAYFGLYVHDMTGMSYEADFDYFCVHGR